MTSFNETRSRSRRVRKLVAAAAAAGTGAVLVAAPAFSAAASATAAGAHQSSQVASIRLGAKGSTEGAVLRPASPTLTAYWNTHAAKAKVLNPVVSPGVSKNYTPQSTATPGGPAVRVAGTTGALQPRLSHFSPQFGSTGQPWYGSPYAAPATTTGKVFFKDHTGGNWVCSGSLVNSNGHDLVITAGHCVYGTAGGEIPAGETWHSNWVFAPDYSNGYAPYGYWYAKQLWTLTNYINNDDEQDDLGAALLWPNSNGVNAVSLLGGQGIAWNYSSTESIYDFGYPAAAPFNGQTLQYCTGTSGWGWLDAMEFLPSNFTGGSSGGPWLAGFNGYWGYVNSVNDATGYFFYPGQMAGLYFGNNAGNLYNTVANL
jgi:V8-like Glu-specific endopeptidase